jgi:hypothetical protein
LQDPLQYPLPCDIAVSRFDYLPMVENLDHREAGKACKSESAQRHGQAAGGRRCFQDRL